MRPGGGKAKGSAWERQVCSALSLWISRGSRSDLFSRNVLSGGAFTVAASKGFELGLPGDVAAAHPEAFTFLKCFAVEAKHRKNIALEKYVWDSSGANFLAHTWRHTRIQAERVGVHPMIVAKQNNYLPICMLPAAVGRIALLNCMPRASIMYHILHSDTVMLVSFNEMLRYVRAPRFLKAVEEGFH